MSEPNPPEVEKRLPGQTSFTELKDKWGLENVERHQLARIYTAIKRERSELEEKEILGLVQKEAVMRDGKAKELLGKTNEDLAQEILAHLVESNPATPQSPENWKLFESLVDGVDSPLAKRLTEVFPFVAEYAQVGNQDDKLRFQEYASLQEGLPENDWSLFDKAVCRTIGQKWAGLVKGNFDLFQDQSLPGLDLESFEQLAKSVDQIKTMGLAPLFGSTLIHLDIAKAGSSDTREEEWHKKYGADLLVHNQAAAILLKWKETLRRPENFSTLKVSLSEDERLCLSQFFEQMTAYHGLIGQKVRGEVTPFIFEGLTSWLRQNHPQLSEIFGKLSHGEIEPRDLPKFITNCFHLVNLVETAAVREGLYTEELHEQSLRFGQDFQQVITPNGQGAFETQWQDVFNKEVLSFARSDQPPDLAQRYYLADRLKRLRANRIDQGENPEITEGAIFFLPKPVFEKFFTLYTRCQHWYTENATSGLSAETQLKLLLLAARSAEVNGIDVSHNFHISFISLMRTLHPDGQEDPASTRVVENIVKKLKWEKLMDNEYVREFSKSDKAVATFMGRIASQQSIEVNFLFPKEAAEACRTINRLKDIHDSQAQLEKRKLEKAFGLAEGELDWGLDQEAYMRKMDAAMADKYRNIVRFIEEIASKKKEDEKITILSIGAGTGALEEMIARFLPNVEVIALDYSPGMIEQITEKSKALELEKRQGKNVGKINPLLADAWKVPLVEASVDTVLIVSTIHEFNGTKDNYQMGPNFKALMAEANRVLKPGGRLIIRDFMEPESPEQKVKMKITERQKKEDDPLKFIEDFLKDYRGKNLDYIKDQIEKLKGRDNWKIGAEIELKLADLVEIVAHYSWGYTSWEREIQERYTYKPVGEYAQFIIEALREIGTEARAVEAYTYLQQGYVEHGLDGLAIFDLEGKPLTLPPFTGVIVIEKAE